VQASPGGTTLLFTDIEGSTRLWEREGERMPAALAGHDALARAAVEGNGGIIVKTTGDGIYAAFDDPLGAVNATLALELALRDSTATNGLALRVRYGLHLGVVERRDNDLFGSPVNRAARIMSAAHGNQVLLSQAVVDQVRERLPARVSLKDLGAVRLRDLATSEHVYQLVHPDLRQDFPVLRSLEATPNNLPLQVTSFIGREREQAEIKRLLDGTRLLTLLGMGGLGKTRLSLQIGADVLDKYPDGVWFVDLAPIKDASLVPNVAAQVLGVREEPGKAITQTLCEHIKDHKLLFVLDNCEHLVAACASLADALLQGAPGARILATSREALHIRGEQTYPVLPLAAPDRNAGVEALLRSEAVQLFVERARLQKPSFALTEHDAPAVAEICARLDGIPLALELAAARIRSMSAAQINERLHDRFKLLTGGSRVALERQQTLRALVNWSYDLLQESEQIVLDRLSVFAGGFDLEAAEAVCGAEPLEPGDILDLVTSLVDKSLVMFDHERGGARYGLLETIREFALEHLTKQRYGMLETIREVAHQRLEQRDDVAATAARHCDYYLGIAKMGRAKLQGSEGGQWARRLEIELDNLRAAIALALSGGVESVIAVKFEVALQNFRILRGYVTEGRNNIRAALALPSLPDIARCHALYVGGTLATRQGDPVGAMTMLTECLALRRSLGDPRETAGTLSTLALAHLQQGDTAMARERAEEALGLFRELGDQLGEAIGLLNVGEICMQLADDAEARKHFEQCLTLAKSLEDMELESECERNLGEIALDAGDVQDAQARFARSLQISRDAEDKRNESIALWCLARTDIVLGNLDSARKRLAEALRSFEALEIRAEQLDCLEEYAALLHASGQSDRAVRLQAATTSIRNALALPRSLRAEPRRQQNVDAARAALGEAAFSAAWAEGQPWAIDDAIEYALEAIAAAPVTA
jgi:predicted ATPase/class 3 adenylate cyclase/Tfp pilus assembly protein PilF